MSMETSPLKCYLIRAVYLYDWFSPSAPCSEKWARPRCRCFFVVQVRAFHFVQPLEGLNSTCRMAVPRPNKIRMRTSPMPAHSVAAEAETPSGCVRSVYSTWVPSCAVLPTSAVSNLIASIDYCLSTYIRLPVRIRQHGRYRSHQRPERHSRDTGYYRIGFACTQQRGQRIK